jgi:hypothetical protein
MSQQNVEFVKGFLTAGADADKQALLAALPEVIAQIVIPRLNGSKTRSGPTAASTVATTACVSLGSGGSTNGTSTASRPNDSSITATTCS